MSRRDVDEYFEKIASQYTEMLGNLREFEEMATDNIVSPEQLDNMRNMIAPLKDNYERWSYMMFLLNKPSRKSKQSRYSNQQGTHILKLSKKNSVESVIEENNKVLNLTKIRTN